MSQHNIALPTLTISISLHVGINAVVHIDVYNSTLNFYSGSSGSSIWGPVPFFGLALLLIFIILGPLIAYMALGRRGRPPGRGRGRGRRQEREEDVEMGNNQSTPPRPPARSREPPSPDAFSPSERHITPGTRTRRQNSIAGRLPALLAGGRRIGAPQHQPGARRSRRIRTAELLCVLNHIMQTVLALDVVAIHNHPMFTDFLSFTEQHGHPPHFDTLSDEDLDALDAIDLNAIQCELDKMVEGQEELSLSGREGESDPANDSQQQPRTLEERNRPKYYDVGSRSKTCNKCEALLWKKEKDSICCHEGKAVSEKTRFPEPPPDLLRHLLTDAGSEGVNSPL